MPEPSPRTFLVSTDLTEVGDAVVRTAGELARQTGGEIHLIHALAAGLGDGEKAAARREDAGRELDRQIARALPDGVEVASRVVADGPVHTAVATRADEVDADLLLIGPHGRSAATAYFLGSTADRILRTSRIPCLLVRGELHLPVRRVGVPIDFSGLSLTTLRLAFAWAPSLIAGRTEDDPPLRLVHIGWPVTRVDLPDYEEKTLRPQLAAAIEEASAEASSELTAEAEVVWDNIPSQRISHWAGARQVDLLVIGTQGRSDLPRALLGSTAMTLAREAPCPVLLVPPEREAAQQPSRAPALDRVLVGTDFSRDAAEAADWVASHLAPDAELVLAHAVDVPYPPPFFRHGLPPREEFTAAAVREAEAQLEKAQAELPRPSAERLVRAGRVPEALAGLAHDSGADLVTVGGHGRRGGLWAGVGSTAEGLLAASPIPVLVARGLEPRAPEHILVPLDDSPEARQALGWGLLLARRLQARLTLLHVVSRGLMAAMRRVSSEPVGRELGDKVREDVRGWLEDVAGGTGLPAEQIAAHVEEGVPGLEILAVAARLDSDLVVLGSRGSGGARIHGLGSVATSVVRHGTTPVLVVPSRR